MGIGRYEEGGGDGVNGLDREGIGVDVVDREWIGVVD